MVGQEELLQAAQEYGLDAVTAEVVVADISRQVDLFVFTLLHKAICEIQKSQSQEVTIP